MQSPSRDNKRDSSSTAWQVNGPSGEAALLDLPGYPEHTSSIRQARGTNPEALFDAALKAQRHGESDGMYRTPFLEKWSRRALTIPGLFLATGIYALLLLPLLAYGSIRDLAQGRKQLRLRFHLMVFAAFAWHSMAMFAFLGIWLMGAPPLVSSATWRERNRRFECWWTTTLIGVAERLYGMSFSIEGLESVAPGPVLLLSRHASIIDTIMPIKILGSAFGMNMRIVKKHELLWDPGVDIIAHRIPGAFVKRGTGDHETQAKIMCRLLDGIGDNEALVVFPEGSRFSPEKRQRILDKLNGSNPLAAARARSLRHVLPIRPAGCLALMNKRPDMDVVICAHTGLEGANKLEDFIGGALLGRTIHVKFWRIPASQIPRGDDERVAWLQSCWREVDNWIGLHQHSLN